MNTPKKITLKVTPGLFRGLASQNMLFHQCIGELVDNSIAGAVKANPFRIDITLSRATPTFVDVWVADDSAGMDEKTLIHALQPGGTPITEHRLNEHGFGLKNSLSTLCRESKGKWGIWTRAQGGKDVLYVPGPFAPEMSIYQLDKFPEGNYHPDNISTLVYARVNTDFMRTMQRKQEGKAPNLEALCDLLMEHLGVHYRGYLEQDENTGSNSGQIYVNTDSLQFPVRAMQVPMERMEKDPIKVELKGIPCTLIYKRGALDDTAESGKRKYKFYYLNNIPTQGIDIRLGKRVIITHLFNEIWGKNRHNSYNKFTGELIIPDLPPGVLTTKNDKTAFNMSDLNWQKIFDILREEYPPPPDPNRDTTEAEIRDEWKKQLLATKAPDDEVGAEISVWQTATRLDLYHKYANGDITIYELKRSGSRSLDLYQLKMYWDGLVLEGQSPTRAVLLAEKHSDSIKAMVRTMNKKLRPPKKQDGSESHPYCFELDTLANKNLVDDSGKKKEEPTLPFKK